MTSNEAPALTRPSFGEAYDNVTWYDEQAVEKAFDVDIHDLMEQFSEGGLGVKRAVLLVRAFELVAERRNGKKDEAAAKAVRELTTAQLTELLRAYLDNEDEPMPEEPVTTAGKGDAEPT